VDDASLVCDTSVLLYLGRIGKADLLSSFSPLIEAVRDNGFRIGTELYREVLRLAGEKNRS